jgi:hypothetical protein
MCAAESGEEVIERVSISQIDDRDLRAELVALAMK